MIKEVTRNIKPSVSHELWGRAAGRCEFHGCNEVLYKSPVTQEAVNIAEQAHIYSFSEHGPRGWGPFKWNPHKLNDASNLLLVCHPCHKKIDKEKDGGRYSADLLQSWKTQHERRISRVTGINPSKKSCVVVYGANIGNEQLIPNANHANNAIFPNWYPVEEDPIYLHMSWEGRDDKTDYWETEENNLVKRFDRTIVPLTKEGQHFSIFGFAPIPLLIRLGTLFTDKVPAQVYQLRREPEMTWEWGDDKQDNAYMVREPKHFTGKPVLIIALSSTVSPERITNVIGSDVSIWEVTVKNPHNDFLQTKKQLSEFRKIVRKLMVQISEKHGVTTPLSIFPSMPVAMAVEFGRVRMPKAEMPWVIYDQNNYKKGFIEAITIKS